MSWLARLSLANRAVVGLVTVLVIGFGLFSTTSLRQELFPSLDAPVATIVTPYPGASPEVVEQQVTGPIEAAVDGVDGVADSRSTSTGGSSVVTLDLDYGTDLSTVTGALQRAVAGVSLPTGVTPTVVTGSTDDIPVVVLAVSSNLGADQVASVLRDQVRPQLAGLDGVSQVSLSGVADPQVTIAVDPAAAAARGVSLASLTSLLQANGVRIPAGQLSPDTNPTTVEVGGPITSVEELANLYVSPGAAASTGATGRPGASPTAPTAPTAAAAPVRLGDIATVAEAPAPATGYTRTNGQPSIGLSVTKAPDANTVDVAQQVRDAIPSMITALGGAAQDAQVTVVFDQSPFITQSIDDLTTEGLLGLLFAVLVILGFLLSVRATLVTAVSIPLSVLVAMIVLDLSGETLNILTLGALTIAIGRVVDDSIVVIENITRHVARGGPRRPAIVAAVREVAGAITASTITTVAVFAPIGLVGGQVGELFRPFAVTVTAALLASLVVSLTVVPVLASAVLKVREPVEGDAPAVKGDDPLTAPTRLQRGYLPVLRGALRRPVVAIVVAVLILAGTFALVPGLRTNFLGDAGGNTISVTQELAPGTGLPQADAAAKQVEAVLRDTPGVATYQVTVGTPGGAQGLGRPGAGGSGTTRFSVTLADDADATAVADDLRGRLDSLGGPDRVGNLTVQNGQGGFGSDQLQVTVRAEDPAVLAQAADQVQQAVAAIPGAADVRNNLAAAQPSIRVTVDRQKAAAVGLTEAQVGQVVAAALRGTTIGSVTIDGVQQDVVVRSGTAPADLVALQAFPLAGPLRLSDVATVAEVRTAPSISHTDGSRSALVTARPSADDLGAVTRDLRTTLDGLSLPAGATAEIGGVSTQQSDAFTQLGIALLVAIAVVYLVMVLTFGSLLQPLLLLISIPFAATGALGLLRATNTPLGVPALIGMLMLVGIVVTNAIVLIDLVNQRRRAGVPLREAIVDGAAHRLRPILMTAVATIFALLPMALGLTGGGVFISQPLAIVVIGGLVSSTLLTLVLVPVLYLLVERVRERVRRRREPVAEPVSGTGDTVGAASPSEPEVPLTPAPRTPLADSPWTEPETTPLPTGPGVHGRVGDRAGRPLVGATVSLFDTDGGLLANTETGDDGTYRFEVDGSGDYVVAARSGEREPVAELVSVNGGPAWRDLTADGPASVHGVVRVPGGPGVVATVTLVDARGEVVGAGRTDAAGRFELSSVPAGEHHLLVATPTGSSASTRVTVPETGAVAAEIGVPADAVGSSH